MALTKQAKAAKLAANRRQARKDDTLVQISNAIETWSASHSLTTLSRKSGDVTVATIQRYRRLETFRPSYSTLKMVCRGLGMELGIK